jgi:arylsulfatase A-like enzyme
MAREDKGGERVVAALERSLRAGMPFFGMLNLIETHGPHLAPRGYGPPDRSAIAATVLRPGQTWTRRMHEHNWSYKRLPDRVIARQRKAYAAEVRYADHCIGSILQALREQGLGDEVTIIVTGDHGEAFGEDGLVGHGLSLGESVLNVPLLVKGPGVPQGTVDEPVSLASFAATVAESLVAEAHPFPTPSFFDDAGRGRARAELEAPWDHFHPPGLRSREAPPGMQRPAAAFYDGTLKLIDGSFWGEALYDLSADPGEDTNLIRHRDVPEGIARMRSEWRERVGLP